MTDHGDPVEGGAGHPAFAAPTDLPLSSQSAPPVTPTAPSAAVTPPASSLDAPASRQRDEEDDGERSKLKTGALLAGAAALANKVRTEAPKKLTELREKRAAGRFVIVADRPGRPVAIGPFSDAESAEQRLVDVPGAPAVVELVTEHAFFTAAGDRTN